MFGTQVGLAFRPGQSDPPVKTVFDRPVLANWVADALGFGEEATPEIAACGAGLCRRSAFPCNNHQDRIPDQRGLSANQRMISGTRTRRVAGVALIALARV